ncbi:MAG: CRISPR-associated helicase Cas3', partial [Lentisphaerota bacterium]
RDVTIPKYTECIAKTVPFITVVEHSTNVAEVAKRLVEVYPNLQSLKDLGVILAAIHDVGKISPGFQKKYFSNFWQNKVSPFPEGSEENHAEISEAAIRCFLNELCDNSPSAEIAGIHHGRRVNPQDKNSGIYGGTQWSEERQRFLQGISEKLGAIPDKGKFENLKSFIPVLAGLVSVSDWIGSDENYFASNCNSAESAQKAVKGCSFAKVELKKNLSFEGIFGFSPRKTQEDFINIVDAPGVYVLESSTGSGKTEAALYSAYKLISEGKNSGCYFALPTKLTSDKIHERVQKFVNAICIDRIPVMLAHGSAWLNDEYTEMLKSGSVEFSAGGAWFNPKKRTLLAPFGVGTVDQALMSVMNVKHFFVRAFGLAGKVVILDEVHSYDMYTGTILDKLVEYLVQIRCTVIILSATLTSERKRKFINLENKEPKAYPLISYRKDAKCEVIGSEVQADKEVKISFDYSCQINEIAKLAVAKAEKGQSVLWINNTVATAQNTYKLVKNLAHEGTFRIGLLHSKFTVQRRRKLESLWMKKLGKEGKRRKGCILISTQVVEQSVDIDADFMITELAPADMLIQRMGRLWRHDISNRKAKSPEVLITAGNLYQANTKETLIDALGKNNSMVYHPFVLWRTWMILKEKQIIKLPSELKNILESVYLDLSDDEPDYIKELYNELLAKKERLGLMANASLSDTSLPIMDDDEEKALTRYSDIVSVDCLLLEKCELNPDRTATLTLLTGEKVTCFEYDKNFYVTKMLHRNTLSIARYNFGDVYLDVPPYLKKHFFGNLAVLEVSDDGELLFNGEPFRKALAYTNEMGVFSKVSKIITELKFDYNQHKNEGFDYELNN